jgi:hypothetical protein
MSAAGGHRRGRRRRPELAARGNEFDHIEFGDLKTVDHFLTSPGIGKSAWFVDPDGNTLAPFRPEQSRVSGAMPMEA